MTRTVLMMALLTWAAPAWATDWLPAKGNAKQLEVNTSSGTSTWVQVGSGQSVEFPFEGPATLTVEVRQRLDDAGDRASGLRVECKGDGGRLPAIELGAPLDLAGAVNGDPGSLLTLADTGSYQVPGGKHILSVKAPSSGPDLLVRVGSVMDEGTGVTVAAADSPPVEEPPAEEPTDAVADAGAEPVDLLTTEGAEEGAEEASDDLSALLATEAPADPVDTDPVDEEPTLMSDLGGGSRTFGDIIKESALGGRVGIGAPVAGSTVTPYLGVQWRLEVVEDLVDAHLDVGWYWVGVDETLAYQDPYGGPRELSVQYSTHVVPIELNGLVKLPVDLPVDIFGGAGIGLYVLNRADGDQSATAAAFGAQLFAGVDIEAGPGTLTPALSYTATGAQLGRSTVTGDPAYESLSNFRLDLAYLVSF